MIGTRELAVLTVAVLRHFIGHITAVIITITKPVLRDTAVVLRT